MRISLDYDTRTNGMHQLQYLNMHVSHTRKFIKRILKKKLFLNKICMCCALIFYFQSKLGGRRALNRTSFSNTFAHFTLAYLLPDGINSRSKTDVPGAFYNIFIPFREF